MKPPTSMILSVSLYRPPAAVRWCMVAVMSWSVMVGAETMADSVRSHTEEVNETIQGGDKPASERIDMREGQQTIIPASQRIAMDEMTNSSERITLNYKNGDLQNILRLIARVSGVNLVSGPEVKGTVTIELHDVHWERALALVLGANNFTYVREDNIIRVVSSDLVEKEPLSILIMPINYAKAKEIMPVILPLLTEGRGKIECDERVNSLIVTDTPAKLGQLEKVVARLDQPTPQILIEAKFVEITLGDTDSQGVDWSSMGDYGVMFQEALYTFDREVTRARSSDNASGVEIMPLPISGGMPTGKARSYSVNDAESTTYQIAPDNFRIAFSMLLNDSRLKLISSPRLQTLDNKEATIRVAETHYKPTFTYNKDTGTYEINELEEIYVGITLIVTPHVNYNGEITLDLAPEVSALEGNQLIEGVEVPITNVRKIQTRVSVKDMNTVAIGGMIRDDWTYSERALPYLSEIPYVGPSCFTWRQKRKQAVNLVIFITPTVMKTYGTDKRWRKQLDDMHLTPDGEWNDEVVNMPANETLAIRERMLVSGMSNSVAAANNP